MSKPDETLDFNFVATDPKIDKDLAVRAYLEEVTRIVAESMRLRTNG